MKSFRFTGMWRPEGWLAPSVVTTDGDGRITRIGSDGAGETVAGWLLPGVRNDHSHAFQFAMSGLAEGLAAGKADDDFWSWREAMYALAEKITPADTEAVAAYLYARAAANGFTEVSEFHYFPEPAFVEALCRAATRAGVRLTVVPVYYRTGDFGRPASERQKRFCLPDVDRYLAFVGECGAIARRHGHAVGAGVHSLRAAEPEEIRRIFAGTKSMPRHLHVAEQDKEVRACIAAWGKRPVRWVLDELEPGPGVHLVHATHVDESERRDLAASGATVVLCPTTEANLGDGIFPLAEFVREGGTFSYGTDSHVGLDPFAEMRLADYGQRLRLLRRGPLCAPGEESGEVLFRRGAGRLAVGDPLDGIVLAEADPLLAGVPAARRLSARIFAGGCRPPLGILRRGEWLAREGRHREEDALAEGFQRVRRNGLTP